MEKTTAHTPSHISFLDRVDPRVYSLPSSESEESSPSSASPPLAHVPTQDDTREHLAGKSASTLPHGTYRAPVLGWPAGNSRSGTSLHSEDAPDDATDLQMRLIEQTSHPGTPSTRPWRMHRFRSAQGAFEDMDPDDPICPGFMWFPRQASMSEPVTPKRPMTKAELELAFPLKTCLKQPSTCGTTSTPSEPDMSTPGPNRLRRAKTVEFVSASTDRPSTLPPLQPWADETEDADSPPTTRIRRTPSCPSSILRSPTADAVMTRTDVHTVTIVPPWCPEHSSKTDDTEPHPHPPTMQVLESKKGVYEIVWDDQDPAEVITTSSTPKYHSKPPSSPFTASLQRVNTKLSEWFWNEEDTTDTPSTPHFLLPPPHAGSLPTRHFECALEDETGVTAVPPNSTIASSPSSQKPSRRPSFPHTASIYQSISESGVESDPPSPTESPASDPESLQSEPANPSVPDTDTLSTLPRRASLSHRRIRHPPMVRRLSNLEEYGSERRFRWHRDSVALARERILYGASGSEDLYLHRDSVELTRKRLGRRKVGRVGEGELGRVGE